MSETNPLKMFSWWYAALLFLFYIVYYLDQDSVIVFYSILCITSTETESLALCIYFDTVKLFLESSNLNTKMSSQASNKRSGYPQLQSRSLPHSSRLSLKLPLLSALPITSSKAQLPTLFIRDFERKAIDMRDFPPTIDAGHIRCSIARYETHVKSFLAVMNGVCCYSGLFVWPSSLTVVLKSDPVVVAALKKPSFYNFNFSIPNGLASLFEKVF